MDLNKAREEYETELLNIGAPDDEIKLLLVGFTKGYIAALERGVPFSEEECEPEIFFKGNSGQNSE